MDAQGNIALAYTVVSNTVFPSLRYTGRFVSDPLGQMTLAEETIFDGTQSNSSYRYGDYSQMTVDPNDDLTFWSTGETFSSGRKNYVGAFRIAPDFATDVGVVNIESPSKGNIGSNEQVIVTVRNFGTQKQGDIPISFQVNGVEIASEMITDSIEPASNYTYYFNGTADLSTIGETYMVKAYTALVDDEATYNDTVESAVKSINGIDLAVNEIVSPVSGEGLSSSESISVLLENFGAESLSEFDITYVLNGESPVTEQVLESLEYGDQVTYTFNTTADMSAIQDHTITVSTDYENDAVSENNSVTQYISNTLCQPYSNCEYGGLLGVKLAEINNQSGCSENGFNSFIYMNASLNQGSDNDLIITTQSGDTFVKVWIDFNDNFSYEEDEVVLNSVASSVSGTGNNIDTINLFIPADASIGEHFMRIKTNSGQVVPTDACQGTPFGETEDYKVTINSGIGIGENEIETNELIVTSLGAKQYRATFEAKNINSLLEVELHDINGRTLIFNRVPNVNGKYQFDFDMSFAPTGIYLIRIGNSTFGKVQKFMVQ